MGARKATVAPPCHVQRVRRGEKMTVNQAQKLLAQIGAEGGVGFGGKNVNLKITPRKLSA